MGLIETEGIVLKTYSLAEADKIVIFLTEQDGLVRGVAKGAKRLKSKFGGSLEPFSIVNVSYFRKEERELVSIRQIELVESYFEQASIPQILTKFAYLSELLVEFAPPHDPNERLYRMAKICFQTACETPLNINAVMVYFEYWLLRLGGYLPSWDECGICRSVFGRNDISNLQMNFHLACGKCSPKQNRQQVSAELKEIFQQIQKSSPKRIADLYQNKTDIFGELSAILKRIISQILNRQIVSEKFSVAVPQS